MATHSVSQSGLVSNSLVKNATVMGYNAPVLKVLL